MIVKHLIMCETRRVESRAAGRGRRGFFSLWLTGESRCLTTRGVSVNEKYCIAFFFFPPSSSPAFCRCCCHLSPKNKKCPRSIKLLFFRTIIEKEYQNLFWGKNEKEKKTFGLQKKNFISATWEKWMRKSSFQRNWCSSSVWKQRTQGRRALWEMGSSPLSPHPSVRPWRRPLVFVSGKEKSRFVGDDGRGGKVRS